MKVGYPDTINSSAAGTSPVKARYASSGKGVGDLKVVEIEKGAFAKKDDSPAEYKETPINMITPSTKKKKSPAKFASAAQRKAVWASKNEKKKK